MTLEQNITAILETYFSGFKDELIEACAKRIMEQIERQVDTPQTEMAVGNKVTLTIKDGVATVERIADAPQTDLVKDSDDLVKDLVEDELYDGECLKCKHLKPRCEFIPTYCNFEPK